jgi:hypothetical protein
MNVAGFGEVLRKERNAVSPGPPERTGLYDAANDNLGMVTAYLMDAGTFLESGDPVNALAAYCYGSGWLHCGAACGLFTLQHAICPWGDPVEPLPAHERQKLDEKAHRYSRLLATASAAVQPAADEGTAFHRMADRVCTVIALYAGQGDRFLAQGNAENALACFSYGHGWLDAGVRAGLFSVTSHRDLFTL